MLCSWIIRRQTLLAPESPKCSVQCLQSWISLKVISPMKYLIFSMLYSSARLKWSIKTLKSSLNTGQTFSFFSRYVIARWSSPYIISISDNFGWLDFLMNYRQWTCIASLRVFQYNQYSSNWSLTQLFGPSNIQWEMLLTRACKSSINCSETWKNMMRLLKAFIKLTLPTSYNTYSALLLIHLIQLASSSILNLFYFLFVLYL